ncbi:hypothetical protein BF38_5512 (plasmid) [Bacillus thuringiensis]|uniref:Uncharacterized protein n=1 Tax=Bacillus thuringiensis TaxID=1428 RepID=A0AB33B5Y2_BACTU|nr:hypothetical protein BF38_5512 [Bacillus thuringiensis]
MVSKIISYLNKLNINRILQTVLKKVLQDKLEIMLQALSFTGSIGTRTTMLDYFLSC